MKMRLSRKNQLPGFTIAELLIVIVVIGILATITYVGYTGVQNTSRAKQAQANAILLQKKIEAYKSDNGNYPSAITISGYTGALNGQSDSAISNTAIVVTNSALTSAVAASDLASNTTTLLLKYCSGPSPTYDPNTGATAYQIYYWDYGRGLVSSTFLTNSTSTAACTAWSTLNSP